MPREVIKESDKEKKVMVWSQLPIQPQREHEEGGKLYEFLTSEEALTELLEKIREIHKVVCGGK